MSEGLPLVNQGLTNCSRAPVGIQCTHTDCTAALRLVSALNCHTEQRRRREKSIFS